MTPPATALNASPFTGHTPSRAGDMSVETHGIAPVPADRRYGTPGRLFTVWFAPLHAVEPWWIVIFAFLGAGMLGSLGLIAGLWAEKFDQMAGFQNFVIMPMTFLSGVFYSVHTLPAFWQALSHLNPFFYMIDGFRHGFFGVSDVSPWISLGVVATAFVLVAGLALQLLRTGYKIRG